MKNGLYKTLSNNDYHADKDSISTTLIKKMSNTFAGAKYDLDEEEEFKQSPAMLLGTVFHKLVLERDDFHNEFVISEKFNLRTNAGKQAKSDFEELHKGKTVINKEMLDIASLMALSVDNHPTASNLFKKGIPEQSIFWDHNGQQLKCRPDWVNGSIVVDLKSAQDASPAGFAKAVANFGYDIQQAIYEDGCNTQFKVNDFLFVVTESKPPYLTAVYRLKNEDVERARMKYKKLLAGWKACKEFDIYPGYSDDIIDLELPGWYKK